jgi:hypothetical protein
VRVLYPATKDGWRENGIMRRGEGFHLWDLDAQRSGQRRAITTFESEQDARAFVSAMQAMPTAGDSLVTVQSTETYRVAATA